MRFDLDKARDGQPVQTRSGKKVTITGYNPSAKYHIHGWVEGRRSAWMSDGTNDDPELSLELVVPAKIDNPSPDQHHSRILSLAIYGFVIDGMFDR